jgi:hypothetical protein
MVGAKSIHATGALNCPHFFGYIYWERGIRLIPCDNINSRWFLCLFRLPPLLPSDAMVDSPRVEKKNKTHRLKIMCLVVVSNAWRTSCVYSIYIKDPRWLIWTTRSGEQSSSQGAIEWVSIFVGSLGASETSLNVLMRMTRLSFFIGYLSDRAHWIWYARRRPCSLCNRLLSDRTDPTPVIQLGNRLDADGDG